MCEKNASCTCVCYNHTNYFTKCETKNHHESIYKLWRLLEDSLTTESYELHKYYLHEYIRACKSGFYINDMKYLTRVVEILIERMDEKTCYQSYFNNLLEIAAIPPLLHNHSEQLTDLLHFAKYLSILGLLVMFLKNAFLRDLVYKAIYELITNNKQMYLATCPLSFRLLALEKSHLPEIVTQLIEVVPGTELETILEIMLEFSQISDVINKKMIAVNAIDYLLLRLLPDQNHVGPEILNNLCKSETFLKICDTTCQILKNLLRSIENEKSNEKLLKECTPSGNAIWAIRYIFRALLFGPQCQFLRNSCLELIILCMQVFPYIEMTECDLAKDIIRLSVATESDVSNTWMETIKFTGDELDITFKKMLILCLSFVDKYPLFLKFFETYNIIKGLIRVISSDYSPNWQSDDLSSLRHYVLTVLCLIAPLMLDDFLENNGILTLLINIETFFLLSQDCTKENLFVSLKVLLFLLETKNENLINYLRYHSASFVMRLLINTIIKSETVNSFDEEIMGYSFCILLILQHNKLLQTDTSLKKIIKYFKRTVNPKPNDTCLHPRTIIAAIDFLWELILLDKKICKVFIKEQGVYLLLDIIDICSLPVQVIGLGCLVDICENKMSVPFILTWRGGPDRKQIFISLLARIFRDECKKIGTQLSPDDIIKVDSFYPLLGKCQQEELLSALKVPEYSITVSDMYGSARPKIYALLQLLNTRYEEEVEVINEHYKISNLPLPRNDTVILHLAKNFFAIRISESWHELEKDLNNAKIEPVKVDATILHNLTEKTQKWIESVKIEQEMILKLEIKKEERIEQQLYELLKKCRLQNAIDALREMKYFARTTDKMFRLAYKEKQQKEVEKSTYVPPNCQLFHKTYQENFNVTAVYNMKYSLENNKKFSGLDEGDQSSFAELY